MRLVAFGRKGESETFKTFALNMCKELNVSLRQMDRIFAYSRLSLMQFSTNTYLLPDVYFMLCFWKVMDLPFYNQISNKELSVSELLMKLEEKLPLSFFKDDESVPYYSRNIVFVVACLLYCYDMTGFTERPVKSTLRCVKNEKTEKVDYGIHSKYMDSDMLNEALESYSKSHSEETHLGLRFILQRIELLRSFTTTSM